MPPARLADSWRMRRSPPYLDKWITANKISNGEHLKTPNGTTVTVVSGITPKQHSGWMWDLTVPGNNDHDFYVLAVPGTGSEARMYATRLRMMQSF